MSRKKKHKKNKNTDIIDKKAIFTYTIRLEAVLLDICDNISFAIMGSHMEENSFGYKLLDLSEPGKFKVYTEDRITKMIDIAEFVNIFFEGKFSQKEIDRFVIDYNNRIPDEYDDVDYKLVDVTPFEQEKFEYKPKDVLYTFNSLCYQTYPYGYEDFILNYIPIPLIQDSYGNYYIKIGESNTMFTSHFDSACRDFTKVKLMTFEKSNNLFVCSDGKTILSADDKAGVTCMLYMIEHNIPGLYYFFTGEEVGGIGSYALMQEFSKHGYLSGITKCISFDRRKYSSIITHQSYTRTCSDKFAESLCAELAKYGMEFELDYTGSFTDSANFIQNINECTNVSIGYFNEHTNNEYQNITFLENLCKACINIDWANLTVARKIGYNKEIIERNYDMLMEFKKLNFYSETKLRAFEDRIFIQLKIVTSSFEENYDDINELNKLFNKWNLNPNVEFVDDMDSMLMNFEIE